MARRPTKPVRTGTSPRTIALIAGAVVVVGAVVFAAFGLEGPDTGPSLEEVAGDPAVAGDRLPVLEDPTTDAAVGTAAPTATGADFDGTPVEITGEGAEVVVFMASWCPACDAELPELAAHLRDGRVPDDVRVVSVSTLHRPNGPNWPPQAWFERAGYPGDVLVDDADGSVAEAYGLSGTPFWVFLRDGEVQARAAGQLSMEVLDAVLADL